ncbi:hypothetical protein [Prevotella pallens]|uniref:hypothetical protein n=1 Tax=Prevotella pallens TaxID=60133 RepID=UPI0028EF8F9F|nr:hypothetical protein [Prevotella pallens]
MDKKQLKEVKVGDMSVDNLLAKNKNDDIDDTFCYKLFEENYFDTDKLQHLINFVSAKKLDRNEADILQWIIDCVDKCFIYHHDQNDYYRITNYSNTIEDAWNNHWRTELMASLS